jgi:YbbR domain-containing protein
VTVSIDLADAKAGSRLFHLRTDQVATPFGVEVTQVYPSSVMLSLEVTGRRRVPVKASVEGDPAKGYEITEITVDPEDVEVAGPERPLEALRNAMTETVMISGATSTVSRVVSIGVMDSSLRLKEAKTARVTVVISKVDKH